MMKAGFAGDDAPRAVFPTIVGKPRHVGVMVGMGSCFPTVGDEAQSQRGILTLKYPIENGIVTNWEDMEKIWHFTLFNKLRVSPEDHQLLLTEDPLNPKVNREKTTEIMFETFGVPALYLIPHQILSLYASNLTKGCSIDIGTVASFCCIKDSKIIKNTISKLDLGGNKMTNFLEKLLSINGIEMTTNAELEIVRDIKEKLGFCLTDNISEINNQNSVEKEYEMLDGQMISLGKERFLTTELFFKSKIQILEQYNLLTNYNQIKLKKLEKEKEKEKEKKNENEKKLEKENENEKKKENENEKEKEKENNKIIEKVKEKEKSSKHIQKYSKTIPEMIYNGVTKCSNEIQNEMFANIVISGGGSMFQGFKERLQFEMNCFWAENSPVIKAIAPPERKYSAWIGGSILASYTKFRKNWFTKNQYDENGSQYIHVNCNSFI
ncbi:actin [Anaeramoeba flamelloides]|uniref:Actin n=1 Tax=Anaeramoeba flamelloides TaxID=1746091 RepID=A0ABQ8XNQ4_9EUKA|nr:actin [Anaeramoeba flamelloides]